MAKQKSSKAGEPGKGVKAEKSKASAPKAAKDRPAKEKSDGLNDEALLHIGRAVADPTRMAVLRKIAQGECQTCGDLLEGMQIKAATLSHHLKELETAGLIETHREGKFTRATLKRKVWKSYVASLKELLSA